MTEFILHIKDNVITNKSVVRDRFNNLQDGRYLVTIKSVKKRTLPQNKYYWGIVVPLVKQGLREAGYDEVKTNEDAHEVLKHLFLKKEIRSTIDDNAIIVAGSTAELKTVEFNAFLEEVWKWAAEYLNIQIPMPNEQLVMFAEYNNEVKATIVK